MPFRVSGKNIDVGEALRTRVTARVSEATAKYFDGGFSGHATIGKDGTPMQPPMGYAWYARMTVADLDAMVAYLRTLTAEAAKG